MDKFVSDLGSPYWWMSVVLVGIAVNLVSGHIGRGFSRLFAFFSVKWRERNAAAAAREQELLAKLVGSPSWLEGERDRAMNALLQGLLAGLAAAGMMFLYMQDKFMYLADPKTFAALRFGSGLPPFLLVVVALDRIGRATSIYRRVVEAQKKAGNCLDDGDE